MNKFLSSISSGGVTKEEVLQIIEETSVTYNDDSSVSINNSANASIYTLPTVGGVAGNSVVVGADGKHLVFANAGSNGLTNPLTDVLDCGNNSIVGIYRLSGTGLGPDLLIDSHVNMLNYTMKNLTSIQGSGGKLELISSNLHMNSGVIYNASAVVGAGLNNDLLLSGAITLNGDINMANFTLNNVRNVNKSDINLSLIPATAGSPGQVLTRASNFDIKNPLTAQLVWTTPTGGGVNNPMTEDLQASGYAIYNASEITGQEGVLALGSTINLQNNNIEGVNTIKLDKITTKNPEDYFINCDGKIFNNANAFTLNNGLSFSASIVPEQNYVLTVETGGTLIGYKKAVFNPVEEPINMNSNNIDNCDTLDVHFIKDTVEGKVKFISVVHTLQPLYCFEDIVMNFKRIYNVNSLIAAHNESGLGLDMIPATVGLPGQVLARNPAFDPLDPTTYKLVWANQSSGGGVTNPMTANLFANDFNIYQANILESKNILVVAGGGGIACNGGGFSVPVTWLLAIKKSTSPFYQTFNTDYITPQTTAGVTIDSKWEDGKTDTQISLQTPTLNINNSTNLSPTNIIITGNIQITQATGQIHGSDLRIRGRTSANVPTNLTLEGVTTAINSTTLNITSTANVIAGNTNFTGTLRTNFIDTHTGGTINILPNLTLADGKRFNANSIYTNNIRPFMNSELAITGLQSDNKTLSNITISAPVITINNMFNSLTPESCIVDMTGTLKFNNSSTLSLIRGGYISVDSKYTSGQQTPLYLKGSTVEMTSTETDIKITVPANNYIDLQGNVIVGDGITSQIQSDILYPRSTQFIKTTNFSARYRLYSHMHALDNDTNSRNVRTSLFKYYGPHTFITPLNTTLPVIISYTNGSSVGSKIQDTAHLNSGDKLCFTLTGLLTTAGGGSMNIYVYAGVAGSLVQVTSFTKPNIVLNNEPVKITIDCDIIKSPGANSLSNVAFCTLHRNDNSVCNLVGTIGSTIPDDSQTQYEIYASHTVAQAGSTFKLLTYSMELY